MFARGRTLDTVVTLLLKRPLKGIEKGEREREKSTVKVFAKDKPQTSKVGVSIRVDTVRYTFNTVRP